MNRRSYHGTGQPDPVPPSPPQPISLRMLLRATRDALKGPRLRHTDHPHIEHAQRAAASAEEFVSAHCQRDYHGACLGFYAGRHCECMCHQRLAPRKGWK